MNTILLIFMIWVPLDDAAVGSTVSSDYIKQVYPTEELCTAAKNGDTVITWSAKPGHRMIGTKQCTDGSTPMSVSIGTIAVTVETNIEAPK